MTTAEQLEVLTALARRHGSSFAELLGTLHAMRFTGPVTLHFLNGQPQAGEFGRPTVLRFPEHPANGVSAKKSAKCHNSVDTALAPAPSSLP